MTETPITRDLAGLKQALLSEAAKCEDYEITKPAALMREAAAVIHVGCTATEDMFAEVGSAGHLSALVDEMRMELHRLADYWDCEEVSGHGVAETLRKLADRERHPKLPLLPPDSKADRVHAIVNAGPLPGMSEAFDAHMGAECWTDPAYAPDASTWAAAWKAAKAQPESAQPVAVPDITDRAFNEAAWAFVEAMPHSLPGPIFNNVKPALHAAMVTYLKIAAAPAAPQVQPKPLTDEQIDRIHDDVLDSGCLGARKRFARAVITEFCKLNGIGGQP